VGNGEKGLSLSLLHAVLHFFNLLAAIFTVNNPKPLHVIHISLSLTSPATHSLSQSAQHEKKKERAKLVLDVVVIVPNKK
jgi:hypothetical protein